MIKYQSQYHHVSCFRVYLCFVCETLRNIYCTYFHWCSLYFDSIISNMKINIFLVTFVRKNHSWSNAPMKDCLNILILVLFSFSILSTKGHQNIQPAEKYLWWVKSFLCPQKQYIYKEKCTNILSLTKWTMKHMCTKIDEEL